MQRMLSTKFYCFTQTEIDGSLILNQNVGRFTIVEALDAAHANHRMNVLTDGLHRYSEVYGDRFEIDADESEATEHVALPADTVFHPFTLEEVDIPLSECTPEEIVIVHPLNATRFSYALRITRIPEIPNTTEEQFRAFALEHQDIVDRLARTSDEDEIIDLLNRYQDYERRYRPAYEAHARRIRASYGTPSTDSN